MTRVVSADWALPVVGAPIPDGAVAWEGDRIVAVGTAADLGPLDEHHADAVILPGFVNAHTHLEYAVYGGFGDGLGDFSEWITLHIERKGRIGWDEYVAIAELGAAECLRSGVTTVGDCSYSGAAAVACSRLGLRGIVYYEVFGADPERALATWESTRARVGSLPDRVRAGVSPHAPYSTSLAVYTACAELGLPLATHLSESPSEVEYVTSGGGPWAAFEKLLVEPAGTTGPRMLAGAGLLGPQTVAAHCTMVDADEIELLTRNGAGIAHCPRSNAALGCGVAPLHELRAAGAKVGLGTDSPASAPSFDVFEELRAAVLGARARAARPDAFSARDALELGTLGAARALGLEHEVGSLEPGKRADLSVVSLAGSAYLPWEDPVQALVFGGSPERVVTTIVDGEVRYDRNRFEWHALRKNAARSRRLMLAGGRLRDRP